MSFDREKQRKAGKTMTIASCVYGLIFSIVWCVLAVSMDAGFMLFFGIPFAGLMAYRLVVCVKLAKSGDSKKNMEPWDRPADQASWQQGQTRQVPPTGGSGYCPYCGGAVQEGFQFCPGCGRRQPQ